MADPVTTFLLFGSLPQRPLGKILQKASKSGWTLESAFHDGKTRHNIVDGISDKTSMEEIIAGLDEGRTPQFTISYRSLEVTISKCYDYIPVSDRKETETIPNVWIWSDEHHFRSDDRHRSQEIARKNIKQYIDLVALATEETSPAYGCGSWGDAYSPASIPSRNDLDNPVVEDIFWINVFNPTTVANLGQDRVVSTPGWTVEKLSSGHILLVAAETPFEPFEKWEECKDQIAEHLGINR